MHHLSYELQRAILSHLHPFNVARVARTCKTTHEAAMDALYLDLQIDSTAALTCLLGTFNRRPFLAYRVRTFRESRPALTFEPPLGRSVRTQLVCALQAMPRLQELELQLVRDDIWGNNLLCEALARLPLKVLRLGVTPREAAVDLPGLASLLPRLRTLRKLELTSAVTVLSIGCLAESLPATVAEVTLRQFDMSQLHEWAPRDGISSVRLLSCVSVPAKEDLAIVFPSAQVTVEDAREAGEEPLLKIVSQQQADMIWKLAEEVNPMWAAVAPDGYIGF